MIKKVLVDIALYTNLLVMDFTKENIGIQELILSAKGFSNHDPLSSTSKQELQHNLVLR